MNTDLVLPGSIPGLLLWCSPVRDADDPERIGRIGVVVGTFGASDTVRVYWCMADTTEDVPRSRLALDLTAATGRAHAAWWAAEHDGETVIRGCRWYCDGGQEWTLDTDRVHIHFAADTVPSLADLDPDDPRTLPDGSRWVDAEALRRVVLHVAALLTDVANPSPCLTPN